MSNDLAPLVTILLGQAPYFLVWLVGLIVALVNWSKYPRPALLTVVAVALLFIGSIAHAFLWVSLWANRAEFPDAATHAFRLSVLGWGRSIIGVIAYGLLFWAAFSARAVFAPVRRRPLLEEDEEAPADRGADPSTDIRTSRPRDRE